MESVKRQNIVNKLPNMSKNQQPNQLEQRIKSLGKVSSNENFKTSKYGKSAAKFWQHIAIWQRNSCTKISLKTRIKMGKWLLIQHNFYGIEKNQRLYNDASKQCCRRFVPYAKKCLLFHTIRHSTFEDIPSFHVLRHSAVPPFLHFIILFNNIAACRLVNLAALFGIGR